MKGIYRRGNTYWIDYFYRGRRIRESAETSNKKLAEDILAKRKVQIAEGKFLDVIKQEKIKFEDFADEYLRMHSIQNKSYREDVNNIKILKRSFSGRYLNEITALDVEKYKAERIKTVKPATVNRGLAVLRSMYNRAIEWKKIKENPCNTVHLFKENNQRLRYLEQAEINKLLENCSGNLKGIVTVAVFTGMRRGEILGLKWTDCDFQRDVIRLTDTKNGEVRAIPMNEQVKTALIKIRRHPLAPYIFCKRDGSPYGDVDKSFFTALKKSGIMEFHFHDLRHTFASQLVMSGVDLNTVRELMGHKSLAMTLRYSHLSSDHKRRAVDLLSQRIVTKNVTITTQKPILENLIVSEVFENISVT
jgi:integrase